MPSSPDFRSLRLTDPAPGRATRSGKGKAVVLVGAGVLGGGLLLAIVSQIDRTSPGSQGGSGSGPSRITGARDVMAPSPLTERERDSVGGDFSRAQLEEGAWVQVADENGRLAQQYSAESVKPLPERELELTLPRAIFYQPDGRVIELTADRGRARVPEKRLERGTLAGNVTIRVFQPEGNLAVDFARDRPVIEIEADDAHFDNIEIRCDGAIHLLSDMGNFHGRGLSMMLDPKSGQIESLFIEKCTEPIVFVRGDDNRMRPEGAKPDRTARPEGSGGKVGANGEADGPAGAEKSGTEETRVADATPKARGRSSRQSEPPPATNAPPGTNAHKDGEAKRETRASKRDETRFFQLVLQKNVRVRRERDGRVTSLRGDVLTALFAMEGGSAFGKVVQGHDAAWPNATPRQADLLAATDGVTTPLGLLAASVLAAPAGVTQSPAPSRETITITYDGPLELRPAEVRLATPDDLRVELEATGTGPNDGRVVVDDERSKAQVLCRLVRFDSATERLDAEGTAERPLELTSPRLRASGERFWLDQGQGIGKFEGAGHVHLASGGELFERVAVDPASVAVARGPNGELEATVMRNDAAAPSTVELTWTKELELKFALASAPAGSNAEAPAKKGSKDLDVGDVRNAHFRGDVVASGDSFRLDADDLQVRFGERAVQAAAGDDEPADDEPALQQIVARGRDGKVATAARRDGKGSLSAQSLDLRLRSDVDRGAAPAELTAEGEVVAGDPERTMWAKTLHVRFLERDGGERTSATRAPTNPGQLDSEGLGDEVARVEGRSDVQVRLVGVNAAAAPKSSGAPPVRVFADALDGDGVARTLGVSGRDVWVVRDTVVADQLHSLTFDESTRVARSPDAGRVRVFARSIGAELEAGPNATQAAAGRVERPQLPEATVLKAEWTQGFRFEEQAKGQSALEVSGQVKVRSTPDRMATDAVDAAWLRIELDPTVSEGSSGTSDVGSSGVRRIIAKDARRSGLAIGETAETKDVPMARFESRRWSSAAREDDPRILRLDGEEIAFDLVRQEGKVASRGRLFIHVPNATSDAGPVSADQPPTEGTSADTASVVGRPLGVGVVGSTLFAWDRELELVRTSGDEFTVRMEANVELTHADTSRLVLNAARLEADFRRIQGDEPTGSPATGGADLTGTGTLLRVRAFGGRWLGGEGRITIETDDFTVTCDSFQYDAVGQTASLVAVDNGVVEVVSARDPARRTAKSVEWNLATGTLHLKDARGG
jgi:hypothetical protein